MNHVWRDFIAWIRILWPSPSTPERLNAQGFDILRDESHLALRCQACATDRPWRQAFGDDGQTLPAGMFAYPVDAPVSQVNLALEIHRLRCAAARTAAVRLVQKPSG